MARRRMIDPDIWQDEKLAQLDYAGRLFFIGLITQSNDYGKVRGNPQLLKATIFPYDDDMEKIKIEGYIKTLNDSEVIVSYSGNGENFIKIKNWTKYQTLTYKGIDNIPEPNLIQPLINPEETLKQPLINPEETLKSNLIKDNIIKDNIKEVILSQIKNLLTQFPIKIQELIYEYIELAKLENEKTKTITDSKQLRLINELYSVYREDEEKDKFEKALEITVKQSVPNINYFKKVRKNLEKKYVK